LRGGKYETYRLNVAIPAARAHEYGGPTRGRWYAVDEYNLSMAQYHKRYALLEKNQRPQLEIVVLGEKTIVNVGPARRQGEFPGGGLQFELVEGDDPVPIEHLDNPKKVRY